AAILHRLRAALVLAHDPRARLPTPRERPTLPLEGSREPPPRELRRLRESLPMRRELHDEPAQPLRRLVEACVSPAVVPRPQCRGSRTGTTPQPRDAGLVRVLREREPCLAGRAPSFFSSSLLRTSSPATTIRLARTRKGTPRSRGGHPRS